MKKHFHLFALFTCLMPMFVLAQKPTVSNIKYQSLGNKIRITYELTGANKNYRIRAKPFLIASDTSTNTDVIKNATGDVGPISSVDGLKIIEWEWYKDMTTLPSIFNIQIELESVLKIPNAHALAFAGNTLAPWGLKYAFLGRNGFYLSAKTLNFNWQKPSGTYAELTTGTLKPNNPYQFTEAVRQSAALTVGYSRIITPFLHVYAGGGVGIDRTIWEVQILNSDLEPANETFWVEPTDNVSSGTTHFVFELGTNVVLNRFVFDFGTGLSNGDSFFFNFGVGFIFLRSSGF